MAKGLKIAHKETTNGGILHDQQIQNVVNTGAVGGIPQWITSTGVRTIKTQFVTADGIFHANGYIITQKGATKFLVANAVGAVEGATHSNASVTVCTLVNENAPSGASTMSINGYTAAVAPAFFNAARITNKYVYDYSGNKYTYVHSSTAADATYANIATH
jgi:hypothetical protein